MAAQALLFEAGRAVLPSRVTVFASGANEAREIRGFRLAGVPVGVAVSHVREAAIHELLNQPTPVFADSGAFSEVAIDGRGVHVVAPISHDEWLRRLAIYRRLAARLGNRLSVVAPDRVADQVVTLERLSRYRSQLEEIAGLGAEILIPVQNGELSPAEFYRRSVEASGLALVPAMPMKKAATGFDGVLAFVREIRPRRIHLLGIGYETRRARRLVDLLLAADPELVVSMDSNRLRAVTGKGRKMTHLEAQLRIEEPSSVYAEVEAESLQLAGVRLDYTDAIASPSTWAQPAQLEAIASLLGLDGPCRRAFLVSPDDYLQRPAEGTDDVALIELPHVSHVLDMAWQTYVASEMDTAVRTAAIRKTFQEARISTLHD
jgi:hypothetical protein